MLAVDYLHFPRQDHDQLQIIVQIAVKPPFAIQFTIKNLEVIMCAGFFETDITPPVGTGRAGGYSKIYIQGFHDPLKARASVLDNGAKQVALVGVDLYSIGFDSIKEIQDELRLKGGFAPEDVIVGASHTHSGATVAGLVSSGVQNTCRQKSWN